jgi:hypothetical protein
MLTSWNRLPLASVWRVRPLPLRLLAGASFSGPKDPALLCWTEAFPLLEADTDKQTRSGFDHQYKGLGRSAGGGVKHAKPVATRRPRLDIGDELARLVGLGG